MASVIPRLRDLPRASSAVQIAFATAAVLGALLIRLPFEPLLAGSAPYATFFVAILLVAWLCGIAATIWAVALSFAVAGVAVIPPAWSFDIDEKSQRYTLVLFVLIAIAMVLLSRAASAARQATLRALEAAARAQRGARATVWDVDLDGDPIAPEEWPRLLGLHDETGLGDREAPSAHVHPEDEARVRAAFEAAVRTPSPLATEFRIRHPVLGERWRIATGDVLRDEWGGAERLSGITLDVSDRKRAERDRELLAAIVASSDDAIVGKDLEGTVVAWNAGAERLFGYADSEVLGRSIEILIPPERLGEEREILARIRRGERIEQFETVRRAKGGRAVEVSLKISPIRDDRGEIIGASKVARDIGDRKRAERALASQREWFRVTLTSIGDGVITTDRGGRVTFLNPVAESLTGWAAAEAEAQPLRSVFPIVHETTREPVENPAEKVIRTGRIVGLANHTALIARDGSERPIADSAAPITDSNGEIIGSVLVFRDVTEQRRADDALAEQREWLETTLRSIGDAVIATDERGCVSFLNPVAERLTGWSASRARGRLAHEVFRIVDEGSRQEVPSPVAAVLAEGGVRGLSGHTLLIAADGSERPIDDSGAPIRDRDGRVLGAVLVFRDVSERRRAERERAEAAGERDRLLESERLARGEAERANRLKDEFMATLSHELRTPLNAILGWTQVLRTPEANDAATLDHALDVIERNTRAQAQLISDLLDMSRMESGRIHLELQTLELAGVVHAALDAVRGEAEGKEVRIRTDLQSGLGPVVGDPTRLEQILWNLLTNAIKFSPRGGHVSVTLRERDGQAELAIRDTGIGIRAEFLPHLFERFRQGDGSYSRRFGGLGLGLAIVKQLAEQHGATVTAESEGEDRGAVFTLRIPLSTAARPGQTPRPGQMPRPAPDEAAAREPSLEGLVVLLVEDEADTRDLVHHLLEGAGVRVLAAADARQALELLEGEAPDLILSDIGLPGMDGYELLRWIRGARGVELPAIAITAFARPEDRKRAIAAGYQSHLVKPLDPRELLATLRTFADRIRRVSP